MKHSISLYVHVIFVEPRHRPYHLFICFLFSFCFCYFASLFLNCAKHMMTLYILMTLHILNSLNSFALNYAPHLLLKRMDPDPIFYLPQFFFG